MALSTGSLLAGRYEITAPIAVGGMGEVWQARDRVLDRIVAAKVLKAEYTTDPSFLARFRNEARHTAGLTHPNIASVYDYGETLDDTGTQQLAFLVMEYVEGQPLVTILHEEGALPVDWTLHVLSQSADGLSAAHRAGVVHRDIKPGNLIVRPDGVVKLTDFGIAQARDAAPLTRTGMVVGTAQYLSPEQAQGMEVNASSDVYSLGVVAYECLTGARPFDGASQVAIALAHINRPPPPLPDYIPASVRLLVERALSKEPTDRFTDGGSFAAAIRQVAAGGTPAAAPVRGPSTTPTKVVGGGFTSGATQVLPATGPRAARHAAPVGPMPPLHAAGDDSYNDSYGADSYGANSYDRDSYDGDDDPRRSGGARWAWLAAALVLVLLMAGGAWLLLSDGDDPADDARTTAPVTTSAGQTGIQLASETFIGRDANQVQLELEGMDLVVERREATTEQLADADREFDAGTVVELRPADTMVPVGATITLYVAPQDTGGSDGDPAPPPAPETTIEVPTTTPAPTTPSPVEETVEPVPPPASGTPVRTTTTTTTTTAAAAATTTSPTTTVKPPPPEPVAPPDELAGAPVPNGGP